MEPPEAADDAKPFCAPARQDQRMLSVIIATDNSERILVRTLAALVPGAIEGLISEVVVADAGSSDDTAAVADVAGCNFVVLEGSLAERLSAATARARAPWLLFLRPGTVLDPGWTGEARRFIEQSEGEPRAAVFRRGTSAQPGLGEALALSVAGLIGRPRPEQGLLISRQFHGALGGHRDGADTEIALIRRIGRRRLVTLASGVRS